MRSSVTLLLVVLAGSLTATLAFTDLPPSTLARASASRPERSYTCDETSCPAKMKSLDSTKQQHYSPDDFRVLGVANIESYAGFFPTAPQTDNNMFWWYFPAQNGNKSAPLLIWLQGGPGGSSMFGLFCEMGPFRLTANLELLTRDSTWNDKYSMIFIDNPVGAGFSYTGTGTGYCNNTRNDVAVNLYSLLEQFYGVFPELLNVDLYVTGESYGGHYVPSIAHHIHIQNQNNPAVRIPLTGIVVGDGWIDPIQQVQGYPDLMFNLGLANTQQREAIEQMCLEVVQDIENNRYQAAFDVWDKMLNGDVYPYPNLFHNMTGSNNYDNLMMTNNPEEFSYYPEYLNQDVIRSAVHVGDAVFNNGSACEYHLMADVMVSFKPELQDLLNNNYKVLIYSGQLDIIIAPALTERFMNTLQWNHQADFTAASRAVWRVNSTDTEVAGFARSAYNLQHVVVRGAGHIVPSDQPERAYNMISHFIENIPFENLPDPRPSRADKTAHTHTHKTAHTHTSANALHPNQ